jgi:hypothetical protein
VISHSIQFRPEGVVFASLPIRTVSEANAHEHWRMRQRRAKTQRTAVVLALRAALAGVRARLAGSVASDSKPAFMGVVERARPVSVLTYVTITRVAPGTLDSDNLAGSQKHIRDGIADALGIDDRSPAVAWQYAQRKGPPGYYGVEIEIAPAVLP